MLLTLIFTSTLDYYFFHVLTICFKIAYAFTLFFLDFYNSWFSYFALGNLMHSQLLKGLKCEPK